MLSFLHASSFSPSPSLSLYTPNSTSPPFSGLSLRKRRWEQVDVPLNGSLVPQELHIRAVDLDLTLLTHRHVVITAEGREAPVFRDDDLLAAGEFVLGAAEGFDCGGAVCLICGLASLYSRELAVLFWRG